MNFFLSILSLQIQLAGINSKILQGYELNFEYLHKTASSENGNVKIRKKPASVTFILYKKAINVKLWIFCIVIVILFSSGGHWFRYDLAFIFFL